VLILGISLVPSSAGTITLDQLLTPGASLQVGDKIFADWKYDPKGSGDHYVPSADEITIDYSLLPNGEIQLSYITASGKQFSVGSQGGTGSLDARWEYTVRTVSGKPWIHDWAMALKDYTVQNGGTIMWSETLYASQPPAPAIAQGAVSHTTPTLYMVLDQPYSKIWVRKDLALYAQQAGDKAELSKLEQRWSQVPEASSFALFGLGFVGLGLFRRFRKR